MSSGILFCIYNIARYPDVQHKCFQEIRDVLGDDRRKPVSLTVLNKLSYLDLVIKETLRLFPSAPVVGRKLRKETQLGKKLNLKDYGSFRILKNSKFVLFDTKGKYTVPAGTDVMIPIYVMCHNPKLFPDPEKFWPERFLDENISSETNHFAYIPFSAGKSSYKMSIENCFNFNNIVILLL